MTEDEAKTKWCPMVRLNASGDEWHTNRGSNPSHPDAFNCIGSECMMWRSIPKHYMQDPQLGFCGLGGPLVGRPQ